VRRTNFRVRATIAFLAATVALSTALPAMAAVKPAPPPSSTDLGGTIGGVDGIVDITQQRVRAYSGLKQQFAYLNEIIYWSVTGVRLNEGAKSATLAFYADPDNTKLLATSDLPGTDIDFVAVDSNHADAPHIWYPTVTSKGTGTYDIQNDTDEGLLTCALTTQINLGQSDLIWISDSYVPDHIQATITLTGGGDAQIFVMQSKGGQEDTWYQSRAQAIASSDGADGPESAEFLGRRDYYGIVVIQKSGAGPYQLTQDCRPATATTS
jgi:hypothetical protein